MQPPRHSHQSRKRIQRQQRSQRTPRSGYNEDDLEFEQSLQQTDAALEELKIRYVEVRNSQQHQLELRQSLEELQQETLREDSGYDRQQLQTELKGIQQQIEELEIVLESRLFSWISLRETFWQIVRFVGLGIVIGWLLRACVS